MLDCLPASTPADPNVLLTKNHNSELLSKETPYRRLTGQLLYLACTTRPDIAAAVGVLCRFNNYPRTEHWTAAKRVVKYLKSTINYKLQLKCENLQLTGFADANWASDLDSRRSTTGYVFKLGSATISWNSKLQSTVALSSCEAEYMALAAAAQEGIFLLNILKDLKLSVKHVKLFEDNQGAIALTKTTKHHERSKHIDIRYHFLKDLVKSNTIEISHIGTNEMQADILTKALPIPQFNYLRKLIGISNETTSQLRGCVEDN
jgi:hypothetical protein